MQKKVLTEVDLYTGEISMPKGFEINRNQIKRRTWNFYGLQGSKIGYSSQK